MGRCYFRCLVVSSCVLCCCVAVVQIMFVGVRKKGCGTGVWGCGAEFVMGVSGLGAGVVNDTGCWCVSVCWYARLWLWQEVA